MYCVIVLDHSNIVSGARDASRFRRPGPTAWSPNFHGLVNELARDRDVLFALLGASHALGTVNDWTDAEQAGFMVFDRARTKFDKEKAVDTTLVLRAGIMIQALPPAHLVIASGDGDFVALAELARERGWTVEIAAFAAGLSAELSQSADRVRLLDGSLDLIGNDLPSRLAAA